jgi:phage virion morphogenesis protein
MTGISYQVKGSEEALADLARAVAALDDATPLYDDIGAALVISTQERFERESGPDGSPWPQSLRVKFEGGKTLSDTRRLVGSLTHEASSGGVAVGTNVIHAAIHQKGGVIKAKTSKGLRFRVGGNGGWVTKQSVTIPARPFLGLDNDDETMISDMASDYLAKAVGGKS